MKNRFKRHMISHLKEDVREARSGIKRDLKDISAMKKMPEKAKLEKHLRMDIDRDKRVAKKTKSKVYKRALAKDIAHDKKVKKFISSKPAAKVARHEKMKDVMGEFKRGQLHSGSKRGPRVRNPKQAVAIAFSEAMKLKRRK